MIFIGAITAVVTSLNGRFLGGDLVYLLSIHVDQTIDNRLLFFNCNHCFDLPLSVCITIACCSDNVLCSYKSYTTGVYSPTKKLYIKYEHVYTDHVIIKRPAYPSYGTNIPQPVKHWNNHTTWRTNRYIFTTSCNRFCCNK